MRTWEAIVTEEGEEEPWDWKFELELRDYETHTVHEVIFVTFTGTMDDDQEVTPKPEKRSHAPHQRDVERAERDEVEMRKAKATFLEAVEHPLADLVGKIWGINVNRTLKDLEGAPEPAIRAFKMLTTTAIPGCCACCWELKNEVSGGTAVLRTNVPGKKFISIQLCKECLREPVNAKLTLRIYKTLTGRDALTVDFKDSTK